MTEGGCRAFGWSLTSMRDPLAAMAASTAHAAVEGRPYRQTKGGE